MPINRSLAVSAYRRAHSIGQPWMCCATRPTAALTNTIALASLAPCQGWPPVDLRVLTSSAT